jgi:hypothetical protein
MEQQSHHKEALPNPLDFGIIHASMKTEDAAKRLCVSPATIRLWVTAGKLRGKVHAGRLFVSLESIQEYESQFD